MFKNEEGFSLLELVVAVGVAGIIAAVALPTFAGIQSHAQSTSATYAASASAAEALANSTIGNTGSTNSNGGSSYYSSTSSNSSYTGGSSSSSSQTALNFSVSFNDTDPLVLANGGAAGFAFDSNGSDGYFTMNNLSRSVADPIVNAGMSYFLPTLTVNGQNWSVSYIESITGAYSTSLTLRVHLSGYYNGYQAVTWRGNDANATAQVSLHN